MQRLKPFFVHSSYDSSALLAHTTEQIRLLRPSMKQRLDCKLALEDPRVVAWREAWKEDDAGCNPKSSGSLAKRTPRPFPM